MVLGVLKSFTRPLSVIVQIELALLTLLRNELTPKLQSALLANHGGENFAIDIGQAVEKALTNTLNYTNI